MSTTDVTKAVGVAVRPTARITAIVAVVMLVAVGSADAAQRGGPAVQRGINHSPILSPSLLRAGGRVQWVVVSRDRLWAVALIVPRPGHRRTFQTAIVMLIRERANIYQLVADVLHQSCRTVPRSVRREFRGYFLGPGRRLIPNLRTSDAANCLRG